MMLRYGGFFVLVNFLSIVVLQSQFGQLGCESTTKKDNPKVSFEEKTKSNSMFSLNNVASNSMNDASATKGLAKRQTVGKTAPLIGSNTKMGSEIVLTDSEYEYPTESSSDGRITGMDRGRSRERRFKNRIGEKRLESSEESTSESSIDEDNIVEGKVKESVDKKESEKASFPVESTPSDEHTPESESNSFTVNTDNSKESDTETEPEEMKPPMQILPDESEASKKYQVDQTLQLLHNQANSEAIRELEKKKRLKKEKLENQEKVMDKLVSVIDSMQKKVPFDANYINEDLKNSGIDELADRNYLYQEKFENAARKRREDLSKNKIGFDRMEVLHEIKTVSMTKYFYSNPNFRMDSELKAYTPLIGSAPKSGRSGVPFIQDQAAKPGQPRPGATFPEKSTRSSETQTSPSPVENPLDSTSSDSSPNFVPLSGKPEGASGGETRHLYSGMPLGGGSSEPGESPDEETSGSPEGAQSLTQAQMRQRSNAQPESGGLGASEGEEPDAGGTKAGINQLKLELMKFENQVIPDFKKSTVLNNVGRIKAKNCYNCDEYTVKISNKEDNILTRGRVAVGRIKKSRESRQLAMQRTENKSVSKPAVTVGRLKTPTRVRSIDKMRPIREEDEDDYDVNTSSKMFNIKSSVIEGHDLENVAKLEFQLRNPYTVPDFIPSDIQHIQKKETQLLGDEYTPRETHSAFRRGMMASASRGGMSGRAALPEGLSHPIVRVQKVKRQET